MSNWPGFRRFPRPSAACATTEWSRALVVALGCGALVGCGSPPLEGVETARTGGNGASSLSITVPASTQGTAAGDLLLATLGVKANPNTQGPVGWSAVPGLQGFNGALCGSDTEGTACQLSVFYKIADGSELKADFSWGTTRQAAGAVLRYSNADTTAPIGATRTARGSSSTPTAPVVTTTRASSRVLRLAVAESDDARQFLAGSLVFADAPTTIRFNIVSFPDAISDPTNGCGPPLSACNLTDDAVALAGSDVHKGAVGASGTGEWELPGGDQWLAASIEIKVAL